MQDVGSRGVVATAHAPAGQLHLNILFEAHPGMIGDLEAAIAWSGMSPHDCAQELREHFKASVPVRSCSCLVQSLALLPTRCTPSTMAGYCMRDFGHGHCSIHAKGYTSVELQHCREDFRIRNGRYLHNQRRRVRTTPHLSVAFGLTCWLRLGQMVSFIREGGGGPALRRVRIGVWWRRWWWSVKRSGGVSLRRSVRRVRRSGAGRLGRGRRGLWSGRGVVRLV